LGHECHFKQGLQVDIHMKTYLEEVLNEFGNNNHKHTTTPARKNLFKVDDMLPALERNNAQLLHSIVVAKLLHVSKHGRPDIQLAVLFCAQGYMYALKKIGVSYAKSFSTYLAL